MGVRDVIDERMAAWQMSCVSCALWRIVVLGVVVVELIAGGEQVGTASRCLVSDTEA